MKKTIISISVYSFFIILFLGCSESSQESVSEYATEEKKITQEKILPEEYLGLYEGVQDAYNLKDEFGEEMLVFGNPISIPSLEHKFLLQENNVVKLQQISLEDQSRAIYEGNLKILEDTADVLKIECNLTGPNSNPVLVLLINKEDKSAIVTNAGGGPDFWVKKQSQ